MIQFICTRIWPTFPDCQVNSQLGPQNRLLHSPSLLGGPMAVGHSITFLWLSGPGGVLGPKTDGGVPLAAENWTQKDRGKNGIWGQKDLIL